MQGLGEDVPIRGEHRLPKGMTDHDNTVVAGKIVSGINGAPQLWQRLKRGEERLVDERRPDFSIFATRSEGKDFLVEIGHGCYGMALLFQVKEVGIARHHGFSRD